MTQPLEEELTRILTDLGWPVVPDLLRTAVQARHGHFQSNLALRLAKELKMQPGQIADAVAERYTLQDWATLSVEHNFLNFKLTPSTLTTLLASSKVGASEPNDCVTVVDYSSPNVAKAMHVGHLRSTVIGDALARMFEYRGDTVIRQNHIGDWGTQFGMLIEAYLESPVFLQINNLSQLTDLYRNAKARFDEDPDFAARARNRVVLLQDGEPKTREIWAGMVQASLDTFQATYDRMGVSLNKTHVKGESSYNGDLTSRVDRLIKAGILSFSEGAACYFADDFKAKDGNLLPLILRKADGGYGYAATDISALCHRVWNLNADRIVYVVDSRQSLHFDQVFSLASYSTLLPKTVEAVHVGFGTVLGEDNRPFKTRSGETVSLDFLLDQAESAALAQVSAKDEEQASRGYSAPAIPAETRARSIALAAVKYADLSSQRHKDYVFSVERMVKFEGNTGPYLQYMHARLASILRKADDTVQDLGELTNEAEQNLALTLLGFDAALAKALATYEPHILTGYLFDLATHVAVFYEASQILKSEGLARASRLALASRAKETLAIGLGLLGIEALEEM